MKFFASTVAAATGILVILLVLPSPAMAVCNGAFRVLTDLGISPITATQSVSGKIYYMDRRDLQNSKLKLPGGGFGHAVEYDINTNKYRVISTATNTWCSSGGYLSDGTIVNTAGNREGLKAVRLLEPCGPRIANRRGPCNEWLEDVNFLQMSSVRWYSASCQLPSGDLFILGGSSGGQSAAQITPSWELVQPFKKRTNPSVFMQFLKDSIPNYLYPFLFLLPTNNLFIFANTKGIIFDWKTNKVVANVPAIPDGKARQYPSTGSAALLPLSYINGYAKAEILICGGSDEFANPRTVAASTCYRIDVSAGSIARGMSWQGVERLARPRLMGDMVYMLDGKILIINGVQKGVAGFNLGSNPNFAPEVYDPNAPYGRRINSNFCPSPIARGYHSLAVLIPDGRVLIAGSNPWGRYVSGAGPLSTEYRLEEWRPPYLNSHPRPANVKLLSPVVYRGVFAVSFTFAGAGPSSLTVKGALISPTFNTHSQSYNMRYLSLGMDRFSGGAGVFNVRFRAPPNTVVAPAGYYLLSITYLGRPATAIWVKLS